MKAQNSESQKIWIFNKINSKKYILNRNVRLLKSRFISMHSILGWASFCMNYCINAAWHGDNQPVALLRCNQDQVALIAAFRSSALLGLMSLIFLLTIPLRFSMGFRSGEYAGTVTPWSLNQLLVPTNTSRWHGSPNHHWLWKLHTGLQATWILCFSTLPPDSGTLISKLNAKCNFIWKEGFGPLSNSPVLFLLSPGKMLLTMFLFQKWLDSLFPEDVWAWWLLMQWLQLQFTPCEALPSVWIGFAWQYSQTCGHPCCLCTFSYPIPSSQLCI